MDYDGSSGCSAQRSSWQRWCWLHGTAQVVTVPLIGHEMHGGGAMAMLFTRRSGLSPSARVSCLVFGSSVLRVPNRRASGPALTTRRRHGAALYPTNRPIRPELNRRCRGAPARSSSRMYPRWPWGRERSEQPHAACTPQTKIPPTPAERAHHTNSDSSSRNEVPGTCAHTHPRHPSDFFRRWWHFRCCWH